MRKADLTDYVPFEEYFSPRVYTIADLHGDFQATVKALKLARVVDRVTT